VFVLRLSIVIPALGSDESLENGLVSVLENRPADSEVIVVLNRSYADPYELGEEVRFVSAAPSADLADCLNLGFAVSRAPIIHGLGCGFEVAPGWTEGPLSRFGDPQLAAVAPLLLDKQSPDRVLAAGMEYRSGGAYKYSSAIGSQSSLSDEPRLVLGPVALAGFYRSASLSCLGEAFEGSLGEGAMDVDLALRLRRAGFRAVVDASSRIACDADQLVSKPVGYRAARKAERLFWRNAPLMGWGTSLIAHGGMLVREFVGSLPSIKAVAQVAGRAAGCFEIGAYRSHHRLLAELPRMTRSSATAGDDVRLRLDTGHVVRTSNDARGRLPQLPRGA
jgi:hypothetical protein